jgi:tRNA A-37 threonylcarbamoyl transferase component Bud32
MADENRYDILQEVGRGAMGVVYKALDRETLETVALKVLRPEILADKFMMERFKNELRLARKITHKNVCRIYEFTHIPEGPCISMEYVEGETIRSLLNRLGVFSLRTALHIARETCSGLREAHSQGIAHRDLKPENVMIDRNGRIKIMDFGVARVFSGHAATTVNMIVGTPSYMAPEQVESRAVDQRADIYSLGLILYEMLTGREVFKADTPLAAAYKQVHEAPPPPRSLDPTIPEAVQSLILRCIEKEPERRFQTINDLDSAIALLGYEQPTPADLTGTRVMPRHTTTFIMPRKRARFLMMLIQVMYLAFYAAALFNILEVWTILEDLRVPAVPGIFTVMVLSMWGIATRVYLMSALIFDHPELPVKFRRLFPLLLLLDSIWAVAPLLLLHQIRLGLALVFAVLLAYLPFSQKTLMENLPFENLQSSKKG